MWIALTAVVASAVATAVGVAVMKPRRELGWTGNYQTVVSAFPGMVPGNPTTQANGWAG